jgi:hypothetical protein
MKSFSFLYLGESQQLGGQFTINVKRGSGNGFFFFFKKKITNQSKQNLTYIHFPKCSGSSNRTPP